jgi:hypothetical protein
MELVQGPTWAECCMDGRLTPTAVAERGRELASTLAYVHAEGVVHRDIKPANILLAPGDRTKLADFGVALLTDSSARTRTGLVIGTTPYLSPEQVRGERVGPPTDVYALGLVLLEALTGHREYEGSGTEAALARLHRPPAVPDDAPPGLRDALRAMTATEPGDRPTAADAAAMLATGLAADTPTTVVDMGAVGEGALAGSGEADRTRALTTPVPAMAPAEAPGPDDAGQPGVVGKVLRDSVRDRGLWLLVGALVLVLLLVLVLVAAVSGGGDEPAARPSPTPAPVTQLDKDLAELREAVTR